MDGQGHELTDTQWEAIQEYLPGKESDPGRTAVDNRLFVNAVVFVLKTGIPWEDLPEGYGKPIPSENVSIAGVRRKFGSRSFVPLMRKNWNRDSQKFISICRSSRHTRPLRLAAGNPLKKSDADERRCLGRSRGGLTTKIHAVTGE